MIGLSHVILDIKIQGYMAQPAEGWRWQGPDIRGGIGRLGKNVWIMTWQFLVYILNGQYSGMCGGTNV